MSLVLSIFWKIQYLSFFWHQQQHKAEVEAIELALEAQREALEELKLESEELYQSALKPDPHLFPFTREGPSYTPPIPNYDAPDGKYNDITKVYTQWWTVERCLCNSRGLLSHVWASLESRWSMFESLQERWAFLPSCMFSYEGQSHISSMQTVDPFFSILRNLK